MKDAICSECGKSFDSTPSDGRTTFVMPSLLGETAYACSIRCFRAWKLSNQPENSQIEPKTSKSAPDIRKWALYPPRPRKKPDPDQKRLF